MKEIILIGGGGHCKSVIDVIEQEGLYKIVGIIDKHELLGKDILGYSVIGTDSNLKVLAKKHKNALITVGQIKSSDLRKKLFKLAFEAGFSFPTIASPRSYISRHAKIGQGSVVMHNALINAQAIVGSNCIINTNALIEHDSIIGDFCHISTNAVVNGGVTIGTGVFFGSCSSTKEGIVISENAFINAGSFIK